MTHEWLQNRSTPPGAESPDTDVIIVGTKFLLESRLGRRQVEKHGRRHVEKHGLEDCHRMAEERQGHGCALVIRHQGARR